MKALLVEPSKAMTTILVDQIFNQDRQVKVCLNGQQTLAEAPEYEPDIICSSFELEDMDALELCRRIRKIPEIQYKPFVIITSKARNDVLSRAMAAGATEVFEKSQLLNLDRYVHGHRLRIESQTGRVLAIEDSAPQLEMLKRMLLNRGFTVTACSSARDAWAHFQKEKYDLVVVDVVLDTDFTSKELITRIRFLQSETHYTPIIAITAYGETHQRIEVFQSGVDDLILKPLSEEELNVRISNLLSKRRLIHQLDQKKNALEDIHQRSIDNMANLSHELRTPLTGILGNLELIEQEQLEPPVDELVENAHETAQMMHALINDVLDLNRIEQQQLKFEEAPVNLHKAVGSVLRTLFTLAQKKGLSLHSTGISDDEQINFIGDALRLKQVLLNLVGNAIKFTEQGSVTIDTQLSEGQSELVFSVTDTGIGISEDGMASIFDRFSQAEASTARNFGGSGLGLAISQHLVQLWGGSISADSAFGKGSTFKFTLPYHPAGDGTSVSPTNKFPDLQFSPQGKTILVVDDNRFNRAVVAAFLRKMGFEYDEADNGISGLQKLILGDFDAAFIDYNMPEINGFEMARRFRLTEDGPAIPIIALTGISIDNKEDAYKAGINEFMIKPIKKADLVDMLNRIFAPS